ncbi:MAG: 23S rRNA (adenine(2503)-C(2))-methyltransferase RlmN [Humidesulfovibrio sp.]|uniref:23S rRNA (adenine(2503)-C(2))-methyltransferase RlmN n=1 Tax=Humidesulfovibrio sp. TaxID=2910988 RepID=UPI0027F637DC|nr:23S rRNA (adenine(2503)-C(2))-methyltransferase RlmN [Humidesulfovibrio sp.]MDQ7834298.1 23S rRNA (adenine(2503)-C(2))-methyltransferase RlmN [Humidesulfovibrio sp.]
MSDAAQNPSKVDLLNLTRSELEAFVVEDMRQPRFRADQLWHWLWQRGVRDFAAMTNLSKDLKAKLAERAHMPRPVVEVARTSRDGTIKLLLSLADGEKIETVLIPMGQHYTQCLSTQVGCAMACSFCSTGELGLTRNMSMSEILGQILVGREHLARAGLPLVRNLVFMGMGEPLMNLTELLRSLETLGSAEGISIASRRATVSSVGIPSALKILGDSGLAVPAISLHAPTQELREKLMPKAARVPLDELLGALDRYPLKSRERVTYEYIMLGGVNDSLAHAKQLVKLLGQRRCKVNLIGYNPPPPEVSPNPPYRAPEPGVVLAFEEYLRSKRITTFIRRSMGQDIAAACGQLKLLAGPAEGVEQGDGGAA